MIRKERITTLAQERIDELATGVFIVDITISPKNEILIELDKLSGGVSIEECVSVSRNVEHNLDREVEDFALSVSSAGMDRPLRVPQQFTKNIGKEIKAVLGHGSVEGVLKDFNTEQLVITTSSKEKVEGSKKKELVIREHVLRFDEIKEVKRVITFGNPKK